MSEEKHEALSALVDGELSDEDGPRLLDKVLEDGSLKRRWTTYHLIGDVMRKHVIDQQPLHAHFRRRANPAPNAGPARSRARGFNPVAGLALAASVAVIAVLGIYAVSEREKAPAAVAESAAQVQIAVSDAKKTSPVIAGGALGIDLARMTWNDESPAVTTRLNGYLVTHNEHLANSMRGMLPYARIVAYDDPRN